MNRIISSSKTSINSLANLSKNIITNKKPFFERLNSKANKQIFTNLSRKRFSTNNKDNNDQKNDEKKEEKKEEEKSETINLFLEDETNSINEFANVTNSDIKNSENAENAEILEKEQIKFPLIYNLVPIFPYAKLTLTNLHRNDLFLSLVMKYGKLNLFENEKNQIEDIAVYFEKEDYLKSAVLGTVCKITYLNNEKLIVEGLDNIYSIKSDKLGKLKFFRPSENKKIKMEIEDLENNEAKQMVYIDIIEDLFKEIKSKHDFLLQHLKISEDFFGEYDISFDFNSQSIQEFIASKDVKEKINSTNEPQNEENGDNFQQYLSELFKFTYFYIHKINTFSWQTYNNSDEIHNLLSICNLKNRLTKIKDCLSNMVNLIELKHNTYKFPLDLKLNFENPFAKNTESDLQRIQKYKEALENKLSEVDSVEKQKEEFKKKLAEIVNMSEETKKTVEKEINKISNTSFESENGKRIEYLNHIFALPWDSYDNPDWDLEFCKKTLDENLYGLNETKERIYEFIAKNVRKNNKKGCVILLTGGPGTGKTRIAKLIGESLKRKVGFISLAGLSDGKGILGFKRTYVSSTPGVLVKEMQKLGKINPVIVIDEIDKVNYRGNHSNVYHALLQLLNIEENHRFIDHYLEIPFDFSNVIFILTSNNEDIFPPLIDRMEVIKVDPYIYYEKFLILKKFAQTQILKDYHYNPSNFKITDKALYQLIFEYCKTEAGVRKAKKLLERLVRRVNAKIETENENNTIDIENNKNIQINSTNLQRVLNIPKDEDPVLEDMILNSNRYGFCVGLFVSSTNQSNSWGSASIFSLSVREIKKLEAKKSEIENSEENIIDENKENSADNSLEENEGKSSEENEEEKKDKKDKKSKFKVSSSGNLGKDSIQSLTIALNVATDLLMKIQPDLGDFFYKNEIHQHVPQVLLPKSGPSAGTVLFLCAVSLALKRNIIPNFAMTGEIGIDGSVLKIGGVKEKAQGAQRYGIKTLVIPISNKYDFLDCPDSLKNSFDKVYFARNSNEIYNIGFGLDTSDIDSYEPSSSINADDFIEKEFIEENNIVDIFFDEKNTGINRISGFGGNKDIQV